MLPGIAASQRYLSLSRMRLLFLLYLFIAGSLHAQTLGGNSVYNFLLLPQTPQLTALGGVNVSGSRHDIGMAVNNPALLNPSMHTQLNTVFSSFYGGIRNYGLALGYHHHPSATSFGLGVHYIDYGTIPATDAAGTIYGDFRPVDYVVSLSFSRKYETKWQYGASLKFIHSAYYQYRSSGIAADAGLVFTDSASFLQAAVLLKNMGTQLSTYAGGSPEDIPFDFQAGISVRLKNAPIQFSLTAYHLHRFDVTYRDTSSENADITGRTGNATVPGKLLRHVVLATQVYPGDKVELTLAYNFLRRAELSAGNTGNGLNGFSMGVGVLFNKIQFRYARSYYQSHVSYHQFGINLQLNGYFGLGKMGERIGW